ncbi:MAG: hypothetical protein ACP5OO_05570 [Chloroflexia bacterium]
MARRIVGIVVLLLVVGALLVVLTLTAPLPAGVARPQTFGNWLGVATPYIVVALLGMVVGLAELGSTFPNYPLEAITSGWGLGLVGLNGVVAALVLAIVRYYAPEADLFLLVLAVGVGFQAIIRTRFVLAKQFGGGGEERDLSLNLGWLYEQFQSICKTQIDLALMRERESAIEPLIRAFPNEKTLYNLALYTVMARGTFSREEEQAKIEELNKTMANPSLPPEVVQKAMALAILETGGQGFARMLCGLPPKAKLPPPARMLGRDELVARLMQALDMEKLADLAYQAVDLAPAGDRELLKRFVDGTVADKRSTEQTVKAVLARFIVEKGGIAFAQAILSPGEQPAGPS